MQELQIYIGSQRLELFTDESVSVTQTIQNVKNIDKVFTDFSKTFSVPASKNNNKIFKHYYNFDIDQGFDARFRVAGTLEINTAPFKTGKFRLDGVDMKNRKPHTYRITFFGDIVELKDSLGQDKLADLNLNQYDLVYSHDEVDGMMDTPDGADVIVPFITHTQRLFYDSTVPNNTDLGNLHITNSLNGVQWNQLKYALKVQRIIEQIEIDYDLEFSTDFFKNTDNKAFDDLYLWLHRKSGYVENLSGNTTVFSTQLDFDTGPQTGEWFKFFTGYFGSYLRCYIIPEMDPDTWLYDFTLTIETTSTTPYTFVTTHDGIEIERTIRPNGGNYTTCYYEVCDPGSFAGGGTYKFFVEATAPITFQNMELSVAVDDVYSYGTGNGQNETWTRSNFITTSNFVFNVNKQMPDMKIIDFLNGLFRMFNLTAYIKNGSNVITIQTLEDYYADAPETYDISEFIETDKHTVNNALPYKQIVFKYEDTKSFLANKFLQITQTEWGAIKYNGEELQTIDGELYEVKAPFGHMQYERLIDPNTFAITQEKDIMYGYCVNESQNAYLGKPLLFYSRRTRANGNSGISFVDVDTENNPVSKSTVFFTQTPSNFLYLDESPDSNNIHFENEINEWTREVSGGKTLFQEYYKDYIVDTFNLKRRLTKFTAHLPLKIFSKIKLNDKVVVNDKSYTINSITTNLLTGKSDLELLNEV